MKSWAEFLEVVDGEKIADVEEKSGIDVDRDKEKGEPKSHVQKFKKANKAQIEFFTARKEGAAKIAAKDGSGPATLTKWHFAAKAAPYSEVLAAIHAGHPEEWFHKKRDEAMKKVHSSLTSQRHFQQAMGELEVWGEVCAQLFHGRQ
jgi:hypothetical protein